MEGDDGSGSVECHEKNRFINLAWQMYIDVIIKKGNEFLTEETPANAGRPATDQHGGSLEDAIRSKMPGLDHEGMAAEEIVDSILRHEIIEKRIPAEVCSPVHHEAWTTHQQVVCSKKLI